jgi:3',5'-cyclic-AMP phosphodiesterase
MTIAHLTDLHLDDFLARQSGVDTLANLNRLMGEIGKHDIDLLVVTGDLGTEERFGELKAHLADIAVPWHIIPGNHDRVEELARGGLIDPDRIRGGEYYYSEEIRGLPFYFMDSRSENLGTAQLQWLRGKMASADERDIFLFIHHPVLDCGTAMDQRMALAGREKLAALLGETGRNVHLFCGHYHFNDYNEKGKIRQYVTPSNIMQIRGDGDKISIDSFDFGFRLIHIGENVQTEVIMLTPESGQNSP